MSEEEKRAINNMKLFAKVHQDMTVVTAEEMNIVLKLVERLQRENEELRDKYATFIKMSSEVIANSIPIQKAKDKVEELKEQYNVRELDFIKTTQDIRNIIIQSLEELIEGKN